MAGWPETTQNPGGKQHLLKEIPVINGQIVKRVWRAQEPTNQDVVQNSRSVWWRLDVSVHVHSSNQRGHVQWVQFTLQQDVVQSVSKLKEIRHTDSVAPHKWLITLLQTLHWTQSASKNFFNSVSLIFDFHHLMGVFSLSVLWSLILMGHCVLGLIGSYGSSLFYSWIRTNCLSSVSMDCSYFCWL